MDKPGEFDEPLERPERRDVPERPEPELAPADRAELGRLADVGKRWEAIGGYEGDRANLPNPDKAEAVQYVKDNVPVRGWLADTANAPADVQRVNASMDMGQGHQLERHEGFATNERLERRVTTLEDPAQLDPEKRAAGKDGITGKDHYCGDKATAIQDPEMFATAFVRGVEHPKVREILDRTELGEKPKPVDIPIEELLGPDGHVHCSGYRLMPVDGSLAQADAQRRAWVKAVRAGDTGDLEPPRAEPIDTFEGGHVRFVFTPTPDKTGWEIGTMYPNPREQEGQQA